MRDAADDPCAPAAMTKLRVRATSCVQPASDANPADDAAEARLFDDSTFLAVVADGIGGAQRGGDAARKTVATYLANFRNRPRA